MRYKHTLLEAIEDKLRVKDWKWLMMQAEKKDNERYERKLREKQENQGK